MSPFEIRRQRLDDREHEAKAALQSLQASPEFLRAVEEGEPLPKTLREQIAEHETALSRIPIARAHLARQEAEQTAKAAALAEQAALSKLEERGAVVTRCAEEFESTWRLACAKYHALEEAAQVVREHARESGLKRESWYRLESNKLREQVLLVVGYRLRFDWKILEGGMSLGDIARLDTPPTLNLKDAWAEYLNEGLRIEIEPPEAA